MNEFESFKQAIMHGLSAGCKREIAEGFESGAYFYGCRIEDQLNYNSLLQLLDASNNTVILPVTCKNIATGAWEDVAHNHNQMVPVTVHGAQHVYAQRAKLKTKLTEVEAATTIAELEAISW